MWSGYGVETNAVSVSAAGSGTIKAAYSDNRDVASHYRRDIDRVNVVISTLTGGTVDLGFGADGLTNTFFHADAAGVFPFNFGRPGFRGTAASAISYTTTGSAVKVFIEVGHHLVKVATSD